MKANKALLYQHVDFLTQLFPYRNYLNIASLRKTTDYITQVLTSYGYTTEVQKWMAHNEEYHNIIASYQPEKKKRLIVGAHYDVCGDQPGADDNASAVAGLLETARLVALHQPTLEYGIDFVAYCLEEPPFFGTELMGSYIHAQSLQENKENIIGMICYEMIGYFSDEPNSQPFPEPELAKHYPSTANFIIVVGNTNYTSFTAKFHQEMAKDSHIDVQKIDFTEDNVLAKLSDHRNYWEFGIPALMINDTSFLRNPNYHEVTDTIDTLDFDKMTEVINSAYRGITHF